MRVRSGWNFTDSSTFGRRRGSLTAAASPRLTHFSVATEAATSAPPLPGTEEVATGNTTSDTSRVPTMTTESTIIRDRSITVTSSAGSLPSRSASGLGSALSAHRGKLTV